MESQRYIVEKRTVASAIPIWRIHPGERPDAPLIILLHGYTGDKESMLAYGFQAAANGYEVILPDARLHGDRKTADFEARFAADFHGSLLEVVEGTAQDVVALIDAFGKGPSGVGGISMGAFATFRAISLDPRVSVATPLLGSPDYLFLGTAREDLEEWISRANPASQLDRFPPCALLMQNAEMDEIVPFESAHQPYERLRALYADCPERLEFIAYPNLRHVVLPEMIEATLRWFRRFLPLTER
jgi:pimeloyl-ACP methyl ester carboxylesterase